MVESDDARLFELATEHRAESRGLRRTLTLVVAGIACFQLFFVLPLSDMVGELERLESQHGQVEAATGEHERTSRLVRETRDLLAGYQADLAVEAQQLSDAAKAQVRLANRAVQLLGDPERLAELSQPDLSAMVVQNAMAPIPGELPGDVRRLLEQAQLEPVAVVTDEAANAPARLESRTLQDRLEALLFQIGGIDRAELDVLLGRLETERVGERERVADRFLDNVMERAKSKFHEYAGLRRESMLARAHELLDQLPDGISDPVVIDVEVPALETILIRDEDPRHSPRTLAGKDSAMASTASTVGESAAAVEASLSIHTKQLDQAIERLADRQGTLEVDLETLVAKKAGIEESMLATTKLVESHVLPFGILSSSTELTLRWFPLFAACLLAYLGLGVRRLDAQRGALLARLGSGAGADGPLLVGRRLGRAWYPVLLACAAFVAYGLLAGNASHAAGVLGP